MKKWISSMLVVTMLISGSSVMSYADGLDKDMKITKLEEKQLPEVEPLRANRYVYTERENYLDSDSFTISEEEARTAREYDGYFRNYMVVSLSGVTNSQVRGIFIGFGSPFIDKCLSKFYHSPYDAAGRYHVTVYSVKKIKKDLLKGTESVIRSGNRVEVEHDGKTVSFTGWE